MGMMQSDEFCEVYDQFMEAYDDGKSVTQIRQDILHEYHQEFSDDDGIMHDVYFALAKAEWMCCEQSFAVLDRVGQIIDEGSNIAFYRELGAKDSALKVRQRNLEKLRASLQKTRATPRKRKQRPKYASAAAKKGMVFWYRSKGTVYGALVLELLTGNSILVALSDALESEPKTVESILNAGVYTAAWFAELLPPKRVHEIGMVSVPGDYNGRAGMYHTEQVHFCENFGLNPQWEHEKRVLDFPGLKMYDLLKVENIPEYFHNRERLDKILQSKRKIVWITG